MAHPNKVEFKIFSEAHRNQTCCVNARARGPNNVDMEFVCNCDQIEYNEQGIENHKSGFCFYEENRLYVEHQNLKFITRFCCCNSRNIFQPNVDGNKMY